MDPTIINFMQKELERMQIQTDREESYLEMRQQQGDEIKQKFEDDRLVVKRENNAKNDEQFWKHKYEEGTLVEREQKNQVRRNEDVKDMQELYIMQQRRREDEMERALSITNRQRKEHEQERVRDLARETEARREYIADRQLEADQNLNRTKEFFAARTNNFLTSLDRQMEIKETEGRVRRGILDKKIELLDEQKRYNEWALDANRKDLEFMTDWHKDDPAHKSFSRKNILLLDPSESPSDDPSKSPSDDPSLPKLQ